MTTTTSIDVVQMALAAIGETSSVSSITAPTNKSEKVASLFYDRTLDKLLRRVGPAWAKRRATLDLTSLDRPGWEFVYSLPSDALRITSVVADTYRGVDGVEDGAPAGRFSIEADDTAASKILCSDVPDAVAIYIARIVDPSLWSPEFLDAMVWELAAKFAMPMSVKPDLAAMAEQMAKVTLGEALSFDVGESASDQLPDSDIIRSRNW